MSEGTHRRLHPYRPLVDAPLTVEDWRAVYLAHQAFTYQVQRIVGEAEARKQAQEQERGR